MGSNMNDDAAGPSCSGLPAKPLSRKISLAVLSESDDCGDDEPPGRLRLADRALTFKTKSLTNGNHSNGNGNGHGHSNGHSSRTNGHEDRQANGSAVTLREPAVST